MKTTEDNVDALDEPTEQDAHRMAQLIYYIYKDKKNDERKASHNDDSAS
jgi:hypothetical protein